MPSAKPPPADKIEVRNINSPDHITNVDAAKYTAMHDAMLAVLPSNPPGLTPAQIKDATSLPEDLLPGKDKAGWWIKCVQLDLEFKGVLRRSLKPVRLYRA